MNFDLGSFLGGVIGGIITLIGVLLTVKYYKSSDNQKLQLQIYSDRPDLKSIDISNDRDPDMEVLVVPIKGVRNIDNNWVTLNYGEGYLSKKLDFKYFDYYFINAGKEAISFISLMSANKKYYTIFNMDDDMRIRKIKEGDPNFEVFLDKRIDSGEVIKVRMFHSIMIGISPISAPLYFAIFDRAERVYSQPFFYPEKKVYPSKKYEGGYTQYKKDILFDEYIKYMKDKYNSI